MSYRIRDLLSKLGDIVGDSIIMGLGLWVLVVFTGATFRFISVGDHGSAVFYGLISLIMLAAVIIKIGNIIFGLLGLRKSENGE